MSRVIREIQTTGGMQTRTRRKTIVTGGTAIDLPPKIQSGVFKNVGANQIKIRVNSSGSNFWTLKPGEVTPKIFIKGAIINANSVGGSSILECFLEG